MGRAWNLQTSIFQETTNYDRLIRGLYSLNPLTAAFGLHQKYYTALTESCALKETERRCSPGSVLQDYWQGCHSGVNFTEHSNVILSLKAGWLMFKALYKREMLVDRTLFYGKPNIFPFGRLVWSCVIKFGRRCQLNIWSNIVHSINFATQCNINS